jgi:hypothetical protein
VETLDGGGMPALYAEVPGDGRRKLLLYEHSGTRLRSSRPSATGTSSPEGSRTTRPTSWPASMRWKPSRVWAAASR